MSSSKNIAKNSLFLYSRMLLNMLIGLFTAGIVLNTLGITDYGIYNIVGGFVSMFSFLNSSMTSATQRFLSFDIGKNNDIQLKRTFSITVTIHLVIAIFIVLILETFGLWYINNCLNVPIDRLGAINVIFQFSIFSTFFSIIQVPYNALITAHERFNIYAYISFVEIAFKLLIIFFVVHISYDKLVLYSGLLFVSSFLIRMIYRVYCRRNFKESSYSFYFDKDYFKEILSFTGWNLFGNIASVARGQGNNLLLNSFFGVSINAAYGIVQQFQSVILSFVSNFQMALNPQIIKSYAINDKERLFFLVNESIKISYFLMIIILFPLLYNLDYVLFLWLKQVPQFTASFIRISIVGVLLDSISNPLMTAARAYGRIKWYQIVISITVFLSLPISYVLLRLYKDPNLVFISVVILNFVAFSFRILFLRKMIEFNLLLFLKKVVVNILLSTICIILICNIINSYFHEAHNLNTLIVQSLVYFFVTCFVIILLGTDKREREFFKILIQKYRK